MKCKVLVTGASGFVGKALVSYLDKIGLGVISVYRSREKFLEFCFENSFVIENFDLDSKWYKALNEVEVVVHTAARAHVMREENSDPLSEYRKVNVDGTLKLARYAVHAGVKRFIFISSIGVNGSETFGEPFKASDIPKPQDPYAQSKWEAEKALQKISLDTGMEVVIIRPSLVYGMGAPGNFSRLLSAVRTGKWLPLGWVNNRRTFISLDNLVSLIATCINHPNAAGQVFLAGDGEDISTTDLLRRLASEMKKNAKLFPIPVSLMLAVAALFGKAALVNKVCSNLQIDITKNRELLGWQPPISLDEGLRRAVQEKR